MKKTVALFMALLASLVLAAVVMAADEDSDVGVGVGARFSSVANADYDDRDGGYSVMKGRATVSYGIFKLSYGVRSYDWDDAAKLPFGNGVDDPWDELHDLELVASDVGFFSEDWGWFWVAGATSGFEEEMDDSFGASAGGGLISVLNQDWSVSLGLMGFVHPVDTKVLPTVSIDWRKGAEKGFSASVGMPRTHVAYRVDEQWAFRLGAGLDIGLWRMADDSKVDPKGYVSETGIRAGLYAMWAPLSNVDVEFGPELLFARSTKFYNEDGQKRSSYDVDSAVGGTMRVAWRF